MRFPISGTVFVFALAAAGCTVTVDSQSQIVREDKRFTVSGVPDVRIVTFDGSIQVESWDRSEVLIEVEKRGPTKEAVDALEIISTQNGEVIEVEVRAPRSETLGGIGLHRRATARLIVSVPRRADVRARSGDGSIRINGVEGTIELRTADGSIRAGEVTGNLSFTTGDGSVTVDEADGRVMVDTGDGGVNVAGRLSAVKLRSGDGSIVCRTERGTAMASDWEIETGDGSVAVYLPEGFDAELDAHTGDGTIRTDFDLGASAPAKGRASGNRTLTGRLGAGGRLLRIRTNDGSIRIRAD